MKCKKCPTLPEVTLEPIVASACSIVYRFRRIGLGPTILECVKVILYDITYVTLV